MGIEHQVAHAAVQALEKLELFGDGPKAHELSNIIKQHAVAATVSGMIPIPGADVAALVANTWTMYVRINKAVGVSFGDHVLKSVASGVMANLASLLPGIAVAVVAGSLLKFIPGLGTAGGMAVEIGANIAVIYVAGKVYLKALQVLIHSNRPLTEENLKTAAYEASKDKAFVRNAYAEGKQVAKDREKLH